jgi:hypothetical protein
VGSTTFHTAFVNLAVVFVEFLAFGISGGEFRIMAAFKIPSATFFSRFVFVLVLSSIFAIFWETVYEY